MASRDQVVIANIQLYALFLIILVNDPLDPSLGDGTTKQINNNIFSDGFLTMGFKM